MPPPLFIYICYIYHLQPLLYQLHQNDSGSIWRKSVSTVERVVRASETTTQRGHPAVLPYIDDDDDDVVPFPL